MKLLSKILSISILSIQLLPSIGFSQDNTLDNHSEKVNQAISILKNLSKTCEYENFKLTHTAEFDDSKAIAGASAQLGAAMIFTLAQIYTGQVSVNSYGLKSGLTRGYALHRISSSPDYIKSMRRTKLIRGAAGMVFVIGTYVVITESIKMHEEKSVREYSFEEINSLTEFGTREFLTKSAPELVDVILDLGSELEIN